MLQLHLSYQQFYCLLRCDLYERFYGMSLWQTLCILRVSGIFCLFVRSLQFLLWQIHFWTTFSSITSKINWIVAWRWLNHVYTYYVYIHIYKLSVIDSINWYMSCKNKYSYNLCRYFVFWNLYFGMEKSWKNHGTFFSYFCGTPVVGFSKVVATFNHVGGSFNLFMGTTGDVWIIPSFRLWG